MSAVSLQKRKTSQTAKENIKTSLKDNKELDHATQPDFIYGGPFIKSRNPTFVNIVTPINAQLTGIFQRSFAYHSLKERFPVILTKIIDYLSREGAKVVAVYNSSDEDVRSLIKYIVKLKNDIATNKSYDFLTTDSPDSHRWNEWIKHADSPYYFTNNWVFSECYVYRRLREGCELTKSLTNFDPFEEQKIQSFQGSLEPMCVVAERVKDMLHKSEKEKRKADFITLLKLCLWSNKCDLSLSMGEQVSLVNKENIGTSPSQTLIDPLQMIIDLKDKLLVDDSAKICDQVIAKAENLAKNIEASPPVKAKCSCARLAPPDSAPHAITLPMDLTPKDKAPKGEAPEDEGPEGEGPKGKAPKGEAPAMEGEERSQLPCPAKMTTPAVVTFDIVCDNAGYELFTDLCLADFLISQNIVKKVRFHVKVMPWFVSDVTPKDFKYVINSCAKSTFNKVFEPPPQPEGAKELAPSRRNITDVALKSLGERWGTYLDNGTYEILCDGFWTSPHLYKDMKKYDPQLYRNLQFAVAILFKGDLNYRKLLGEKNWNPYSSFESALQGFIPAPIIALRTVKADLICGLPKGKFDQLNKTDERWMEKGDYGVIQFCAKSEALKLSDRPCHLFGTTCRGETCAAKGPS